MGLARNSSFAVGDSNCAGPFKVFREGRATRAAVSVVERGMEALRRARSEV